LLEPASAADQPPPKK